MGGTARLRAVFQIISEPVPHLTAGLSWLLVWKCLREAVYMNETGIADNLYGRMNDSTASACLKGACGDEMEIYLIIENNKITNIKYYTSRGCQATRMCAAAAARLAKGKTVREALSISAGMVIDDLKDIPGEYLHCSVLAVSTLYRAIADYLLSP